MFYEPKRLPTWDELLFESLRQSNRPNFEREVLQLRSKPRKILFELGRFVTHVATRDPTFRKFVDSSWEEVVDIIASQVAENNRIRHNFVDETYELKPMLEDGIKKCNRKYQQQPCTRHTAKQRVSYIKDFCKPEDPILLLGDDDLIGIELASQGFQNISVVDIDESLLKEISSRSSQYDGLALYHHDLRAPPPEALKNKDYKLVFLDPFYSIEGVKLFMNAAHEITKTSTQPYYFLSIHLMSLLRKGFTSFTEVIQSYDLDLLDFQRAFNLYQVPSKTKHLIKVVNNTVTNSKTLRSEGSFDYFTSDAMLLRPRKINRRKVNPTLSKPKE